MIIKLVTLFPSLICHFSGDFVQLAVCNQWWNVFNRDSMILESIFDGNTSDSTFKSMVIHDMIKQILINKHEWLENMAEDRE